MKHQKNHFLNLVNLRCPDPIIRIRNKLREIKFNETILIYSDDPSTKRDIPKLCCFMGHTLIHCYLNVIPYKYLLKKGKKI
ncbi:sulfurtransferase TusA [Buchnera aphidicola (Formosaphis micheliae)]|uniref:sulfurtransferase TusA n=1 Tax=Buchnera aphidicola TaxID=9 RepID=UPI0031B8A155